MSSLPVMICKQSAIGLHLSRHGDNKVDHIGISGSIVAVNDLVVHLTS
jgi:hypothetical protein